jgi:catechol 2,3-dioxygenase-like lactoylglutathione lyase family enzyme
MTSPANAAPVLNAVVETALYVADLERARRFYETVFELEAMFHDERVAAYPIGPSVFLLFQRGTTDQPARPHGGLIPPHDGQGRLHFAFSVPASALEAWRTRLQAHGVDIEGEVKWPKGGHSLYFRDPDGNLAELVTPGIWANY